MQNFLVNLAIIKANSDKNLGVLDNYMLVLAFCLKQLDSNIVSTAKVQDKFFELTEFRPPQAVILTLIKRATKKYNYLERQVDGSYKINKDRLPIGEYERERDAAIRRFNGLRRKFVEYCRTAHEIDFHGEEFETAFFESMYLLAPSLYKSVVRQGKEIAKQQENHKILVAKFIQYCSIDDHDAISVIEDFVRGAMLTEVFYYSDPDRVERSLGDVKVFFDTQFLVRALGLCDPDLVCLSTELVDMLKKMGTKMRCFRDTLNEIDGILYAAEQARKNGRLRPYRPGDVFDYYCLNGGSASDIRLDRSKLEQRLKQLGITVEDRPAHTRELGLDEIKLSATLDSHLISQSPEARRHDIDCATAIHRLRKGRSQNYLESCEAIFITSNSALANGITQFFKETHGRSDISACMPDQVFTTLVWMKTENKRPSLPVQMLVANCIASLQPKAEDWATYLDEVEKLELSGDITAEDVHLLVHSVDARSFLVDNVISANDAVFGSPKTVLAQIKANLLEGVEIDARADRAKLQNLTHFFDAQKRMIRRVSKIVVVGVSVATLIYLWLYINAKANYSDVLNFEMTVGFACATAMLVLSMIYILFSVPGFRLVMRLGDKCADFLERKIFPVS